MDKQKRIQAIESIILKVKYKYLDMILPTGFRNDIATALEEAIGVDELEASNLFSKIDPAFNYDLAKAISTNKEVIKING